MKPHSSPDALGIGPSDWVPKDDGPPCVCGCGEYRHRRLKGKPRDCLYCRDCSAYKAKGLGL